jgi:hypothetical protein
MSDLETGVRAAREAQWLSALQEIADDLKLVVRERSLEVAMDAASQVFDRLEGVELRDAFVRLLSEIESEAREKALLVATLLMSVGLPASDPMTLEMYNRATR